MKQLRMKFVLMLVIALTLILGIPNAMAYEAQNCVSIETHNYYAREVHSDFIVRNIEVCLSHTTKSISYELPPLTVPLVLKATDNATLTVRLSPINNSLQPFFILTGESVEVVLPQSAEPVRYQMEVSTLNGSGDVIEGFIDGQVIGRILLRETRSENRNTLIAALGGLSTEWQFMVTSRPPRSLVQFGLITTPSEVGRFNLSEDGWIRMSRTIEVLGDEWLDGGYFAIKATFPK